MMKKYIVFNENVVDNIVIATEEEAQKNGWSDYPSDINVSKGWVYENGTWSSPQADIEEIKSELIEAADLLLIDSNKLVAPDLWEVYTQVEKDNISTYRNELRDVKNVVQQEGFDYETYKLPTLLVN